MSVPSFAALSAKSILTTHATELPDPGPTQVKIRIHHCGICHSDIHLIDNDWGMSRYPLVPGHEIIGTVIETGSQVTRLKMGMVVGVGWQAGSCGTCEWCQSGQEQLCQRSQPTCVGRPGGFAHETLADERFAIPIPDGLAQAEAAPLLCAGITVYSPLSRHVPKPASVGVVGIGGLGHLAVQFASVMGHKVTALSSSADKEPQTRQLGATAFIDTSAPSAMKSAYNSLDYVLVTVSAPLDWTPYVNLLRPNGTLCFVGATGGPISIPTGLLLGRQRSVTGSNLGSPGQIAGMLALAARHSITAVSERMPLDRVNEALDRVRTNQARFRMVLDMPA